MRNVMRIGMWALLLTAGVGPTKNCPAQSTKPATSKQPRQKLIPAGNLWRKEAVNLASEGDTVALEVRKARDAYWNKRFPLQTPQGVDILDLPHGSSVVHQGGGLPQEIPDIQEYQWIIGRFESFHVYQTSGRGGLYTEMNVRVQHVFGVHPQSGLAEGQLIDIALQGGAAIDSQGNKIDFLNTDYLPLIQPEHTYLMEVIPCQQLMKRDCGGFYLPGRKWDLTSGIVQPVSDYDVKFAATGKSHLAGTPTSTIIQRFEQMLTQSAQDGSK